MVWTALPQSVIGPYQIVILVRVIDTMYNVLFYINSTIIVTEERALLTQVPRHLKGVSNNISVYVNIVEM